MTDREKFTRDFTGLIEEHGFTSWLFIADRPAPIDEESMVISFEPGTLSLEDFTKWLALIILNGPTPLSSILEAAVEGARQARTARMASDN
jgi:hypothetical protein